MSADRRTARCLPLLFLAAPASRAAWARVGVLLLAAGLALAPMHGMAADKHAKVLHPPGNVQANATRQTLLKQRSSVLGTASRHAGKIVGGSATPAPKTIVTKRFLPK